MPWKGQYNHVLVSQLEIIPPRIHKRTAIEGAQFTAHYNAMARLILQRNMLLLPLPWVHSSGMCPAETDNEEMNYCSVQQEYVIVSYSTHAQRNWIPQFLRARAHVYLQPKIISELMRKNRRIYSLPDGLPNGRERNPNETWRSEDNSRTRVTPDVYFAMQPL